jgi:hypothetical protein
MRIERVLRGLLLLGVIGGSTAALAQRKPKDFVPNELTDEQLAAQRERSKYKYTRYDGDAPVDSEPFPWMAVGMAVIAFGAAAPFAIKYYRSTSAEVASTKTFGAAPQAEDDDAGEEPR